MSKRPPKWADRFLEWFCSEEQIEILQGDLYELYEWRIAEKGIWRAKLCYIKDVLDMLRPFALKKKSPRKINHIAMLKSYLKISLRNLIKHKVHTGINVAGLVLGITCGLVLFMLVKYELSFNNYHENGDQIYRISSATTVEGSTSFVGGVPIPMLDAAKEEIVGLENATLLWSPGSDDFKIDRANAEQAIFKNGIKVAYTDASFFEVFTWPWSEGNPKESLSQPNELVISESLADRFFLGSSAMGQVIYYGDTPMTIVGIVDDAPENSDLPFDAFVSIASMANNPLTQKWTITSESVALFVQAAKGVSREQLAVQMPKLKERMPEKLRKYFNENAGFSMDHVLEPLSEYHFDTRFENFSGRVASRGTLNTYAVVGLLLIITACVNFVNMTLAIASKRTKEVGVRKVLGSSRGQLVLRFILETFAVTFLSIVLSVVLAGVVMRLWVNDFMEVNILMNPFQDTALLSVGLGLLIIITLLAGLVPAFTSARIASIRALRGHLAPGGKWSTFRRGLVVFQLLAAQVLIFGTIVVIRQIDFATSSDLGFEKEFIINVGLPDTEERTRQLLKSELSGAVGVESFTFSQNPPISASERGGPVNIKSKTGEMVQLNLQIRDTDDQYQETYQLKMIAGEWLADKKVADRYVVNETFARKIGFKKPKEALGFNIQIWGIAGPIVGIVEDFYAKSIHHEIGPMIFWNDPGHYRSLGLKLNATNVSRAVEDIERVWEGVYPDQAMNFYFLDDQIQNLYAGEMRMSKIMSVFATITILVGCLGLYGMVLFMASQKSKEVSVRKVLGASAKHIIQSFSLEFIKLTVLAFIIAAPVGYYFMNNWLRDFAFGVDIGPGVFMIVIGASILITILTTGYQSFKVATSNPIDSLRNE
ncbi:MAG: FtsX-like permease family protein [Roseivirga sp.]|nr:FtsX-like permease family protein [Roseivirga sp.]